MKSIEKIIERQLRQWESERRRREEEAAERDVSQGRPRVSPRTIITISRETGAGGTTLARLLAKELGFQVFDREIVDHISARSGIRQRLVESLDEKSQSELRLWVEGLVHQKYVNASDYLESLISIIGSMAELGDVIIVGRGANFILGLERGVHVRVVASLEARVKHMTSLLEQTPEEARRYIEKTDQQRRSFIRKHYGAEWSDPTAYHLVLNTAATGFDRAASVILRLLADGSPQG